MHESTRLLIENWAARSNVDFYKLALEKASGVAGRDYLPNTVEISVIYGGALDEEFIMDELYAVNVVDDVIAPDCEKESQDAMDPDIRYREPWEIRVFRVSNEFGDLHEAELIYKKSSSDSE